MDEATWLSTDDPLRMLQFIEERHAPSERKLRLFACASARLLSNPSDYDQACIKVVESLEMQHYDYSQIDPLLGYGPAQLARHHAYILRDHEKKAAFLRDIFGNPFHVWILTERSEKKWSAILDWNDRAIPRLAQAIYDERRFEDMPILADSLEEAGCHNQDILHHCRGMQRCHRCLEQGEPCDVCQITDHPGFYPSDPDNTHYPHGPHCRGCWAIDLILGKS